MLRFNLSSVLLAAVFLISTASNTNAALFDPADMEQNSWRSWDQIFSSSPAPVAKKPKESSQIPEQKIDTQQQQGFVTPAPVYNTTPTVQYDQAVPSSPQKIYEDPAYYNSYNPSANIKMQPPSYAEPKESVNISTSAGVATDPYLVASPIIGTQSSPSSPNPGFWQRIGNWFKGRFEMPNDSMIGRPDLPRTTAVTGRPRTR